MKKLMIAAAIAMVAVASQAYSIQWGAMNLYIPQADDVKKDQTGIVASSGDKFAAGDLAMKLYWVSSSGNVYIDTFTTTAEGTIVAQNLGGEGSDLYNAMVADKGSSWKPQYYATATYETADGVYTFSGTTTATKKLSQLSSYNIAASQIGSLGSWDYKANVEPTPEPTSAMLLLLGVAGLALKRKRA